MDKILYLMRHGQTLFNVRRKIQGVCDAPLTELGIEQAKKAAEYFRENQITFDHAYSSASERACDTLELVTDMYYKRTKGLKEWNFGVFEGESEDLNPKLPYKKSHKTITIRLCHANNIIEFLPKYIIQRLINNCERRIVTPIPAKAEIMDKNSLPYIPIDISSECPEKRIFTKPAITLIANRTISLLHVNFTLDSYINVFLTKYPIFIKN